MHRIDFLLLPTQLTRLHCEVVAIWLNFCAIVLQWCSNMACTTEKEVLAFVQCFCNIAYVMLQGHDLIQSQNSDLSTKTCSKKGHCPMGTTRQFDVNLMSTKHYYIKDEISTYSTLFFSFDEQTIKQCRVEVLSST